MELFWTFAEDIFVYILLAWVFLVYSKMYRKHAITQSEYKLVRAASIAALIFITLDVIRRIIWPPK
jgi:hypothetical protein